MRFDDGELFRVRVCDVLCDVQRDVTCSWMIGGAGDAILVRKRASQVPYVRLVLIVLYHFLSAHNLFEQDPQHAG